MIFDTHAHYDDEQFEQDREQLLGTFAENGIANVVDVGADMDSSKAAVDLSEKYDFVYSAVGVHPNCVGDMKEEDIETLRSLAAFRKVVAIGEIGLDYYYDEPAPEIQKQWFKEQLELAKEIQMPVIIHSRDAAKDTLEIIKQEMDDRLKGVIHCFSYSKEIAEQYLDMGFYLGIGGVVTFKNAKQVKKVVEYAPLERIVLETDCPYLAPEPHRGTRNSSLNIPHVIDVIAELKQIDPKEVEEVTYQNALKLYQITDGGENGKIK